MKNRIGFVSNSSSTSFIIVTDYETDVDSLEFEKTVKLRYSNYIKYTITNYKELIDYLYETFISYYSGIAISFKLRKEHVLEYINKDEYLKKLYEEYNKHLEDGHAIYIGSVSGGGDGGDAVSSMLHSCGFDVKHDPRIITFEGYES